MNHHLIMVLSVTFCAAAYGQQMTPVNCFNITLCPKAFGIATTAQDLYKRLLGRCATSAEMANQGRSILMAGMQVKNIVQNLVLSSEFKNKFVDGNNPQEITKTLYTKLLNRSADVGGTAFFSSRIPVNGYEWVAQSIMSSFEYQQKYNTTQVPGDSSLRCIVFDNTSQAYCRFAMHCPDDLSYQTNALLIGGFAKTMKQLVNELVMSSAYGTRISSTPPDMQIQMLYLSLLNRAPTAAEAQAAVLTLQQLGYRTVATNLMNSPEYNSKYGDWMVPGQDTDPDGKIYVNGWPPDLMNSSSGSSNNITNSPKCDQDASVLPLSRHGNWVQCNTSTDCPVGFTCQGTSPKVCCAMPMTANTKQLTKTDSPTVDVLFAGNFLPAGQMAFTAPATSSLIQTSKNKILFDLGTPADWPKILQALTAKGVQLTDLTYGIWSHGHPDHFGSLLALPKELPLLSDSGNFLDARNTLVWFSPLNMPQGRNDLIMDDNLLLRYTPGHTNSDISALVYNVTSKGTVGLVGDLVINGPQLEQDPSTWCTAAADCNQLKSSLKKVVCESQWIIPGHGSMFQVTDKMRTNVGC